MCTHRSSAHHGHGRQRARGHGQSMEDAALDAHGLVLPEDAVGAQLGQPDVEQVVALCLTVARGGGLKRGEDRMSLPRLERNKMF